MKKLTLLELQNRIKQKYPNESFKILKFNGLGKEGQVQCVNCGNVITISKMGNFFAATKKHGCTKCQGLYKEREQKIDAIKKKYKIIDTFVRETYTYYTVQCKTCGHIRTSTLSNLYRHLQCGCDTGMKRKRTSQEFIKEVNDFSNSGKYFLVGKYVNQTTPILLRHECGFIWKVRPSDIIHGRISCPKCSRFESKNVRYIASLLRQNNIPFEQERRLKNSRQHFDFYLEKSDLKVAIEYNGEQHYKEVPYFKTTLKEQQERDFRKQEYCKKNNIFLIVIPYTKSKEEIREIILQLINKFNDYPKGSTL